MSGPSHRAGDWRAPSRRLRLARDERLFRRGDPVEWLFLVESGRLRLERSLEDGTTITLATVHRGQELAVSSLYTPTYHCDAVAEVSSRIAAVRRQEALAAIRSEPEISEALIDRLASEVRRLRALLELRSIHPATDRVLHYLRLSDLFSVPTERRPLKAIAAEIGLAPETLYRALAALEEQGKIERVGRTVQLKT